MNETLFTSPLTVAVLGATGYVGGRLVPRLLEQGYRVIAISRSLAKLRSRPWAQHPNVLLRSADVLGAGLDALEGAQVVFYLVHSMEAKVDFAEADRLGADNLVESAARHGLQRIIYLGGLGEDHPGLSPHLRSRAEVAEVLAAGPVPVTTLRAAMIIGSGSASFEMLRYLVDRLPVMVTPKWVTTPCQPIAIRNVLDYLLGCLEVPATVGQTFDIGGPDVVTYADLMQLYAELAGLKRRWIVPVPVFTPRLSSYWIHLVTPVQAAIARPLAEGLRNPVVCQETRLRKLLPRELLSCREAMSRALLNHLSHEVESHWTDAGKMPAEEAVHPGDADWSGGTVYCDRRLLRVSISRAELWRHIVRIGGETGWYYGNTLWRIRGIMDKLAGGVGDRRGRRHPDRVQAGDALDFWRVLAAVPESRLRLIAEMKVPGEAILDFQLHQQDDGVVLLEQTAWFVPTGLLGILYWHCVAPFHDMVFAGMLRGIAKAAGAPVLQGPWQAEPPSA